MDSTKTTGRITGALLLIQMVIGFLINQVLAGPFTFATDYLTKMAAHPSELTLSMLLGLISGGVSVGLATLLLPLFRKHHEGLAFAFLVFSGIDLAILCADNYSIQSLLSLSQEYVKAGAPDSGYFITLGQIHYNSRLWTHLMTLLVPCFSLTVFYYLLFTSKLIPRFISVWGLLGVLSMFTAVLLAILHLGSYMMLYLPIGLNQLVLVVWLGAKGFNGVDSLGGYDANKLK